MNRRIARKILKNSAGVNDAQIGRIGDYIICRHASEYDDNTLRKAFKKCAHEEFPYFYYESKSGSYSYEDDGHWYYLGYNAIINADDSIFDEFDIKTFGKLLK